MQSSNDPSQLCLNKNNIIFMEGAQKEYYIVVQACLMETLYSVEIPAFTTKPHSSSNAIANQGHYKQQK